MAVPSDKFYEAEIIERRDFSHDLWAVRIRPGGELKFAPGQYATFGVVEDNKVIERPYSIVSSPYEDTLEFFFELVPEGELTPRLHKLKSGERLVMRKVAKGRFTLDTQSGHKNHFLVATVTGLAPYVSMVRTAQRDWKEGKFPAQHHLYILQGASRSWELGYREEMEGHAKEVPWLTYIPTISRPWEDKEWKGEVGRCEDILRKYSDQFGLAPGNTTAYLCGHPEMIEKAKGILQRRGFLKESLREEQYWVQK
ncbi:MAG: ferredoxin--NADP reductase [Acidobacteria bacterium]|nr:ferredoxin--NADP reductase [Acidobacteriota bacterium]